MKKLKIIAKGIGGITKVVTGQVIEWSDSFFEKPIQIKDKVVYNEGDAPLYRMAFLIENEVKAVLLEKGGRNYHPLILLSDALVPAVAGIGKFDLADKEITIDSSEGMIFEGEVELKDEIKSPKEVLNNISKSHAKVYVNVGYPTALKEAAETGADGIGLLRTEFTAARTLSKIINQNISEGVTVKQAIEKSNEADVIYAITKHNELKEWLKDDLKETIIKALDFFGEKEVIIRTFDIARDEDDPMGNRGIRRCISEGGESIEILAKAIKEALTEKKSGNIGVILPLVSHYSQIKSALDIILNVGLSLEKDGNYNKKSIKFGWEIEQPAASQNNEIWLEVFMREYDQPPHMIGIGTNDLTQFTIALERDAYSKEKDEKINKYLKELYNESDFSVIRQIYEVSRYCKKVGTKLFLLGEAAANPPYTELMLAFDIIPSVKKDSVNKVQNVAYEFERIKKPDQVIEEYIEKVCSQYPYNVRNILKSKFLQILTS